MLTIKRHFFLLFIVWLQNTLPGTSSPGAWPTEWRSPLPMILPVAGVFLSNRIFRPVRPNQLLFDSLNYINVVVYLLQLIVPSTAIFVVPYSQKSINLKHNLYLENFTDDSSDLIIVYVSAPYNRMGTMNDRWILVFVRQEWTLLPNCLLCPKLHALAREFLRWISSLILLFVLILVPR